MQRDDELCFAHRAHRGAAFVAPEQVEGGRREMRRRFERVKPIVVIGRPDPVSDRQDDGADARFAEHLRYPTIRSIAFSAACPSP